MPDVVFRTDGAWSRLPRTSQRAPAPVSRIESRCLELGFKMTGQRRTIARVLSDAHDHPDVEEVYRRALELDRRISIATVYRTVRMLEEQGIVQGRTFGGSRARYDASDYCQNQFIVDVDTGRVIGFQDQTHVAIVQGIAAKLGFDLLSYRLELFGRRTIAAEA
jgi:Fur family ferric uptake transcriptional regulator